MTAERPEVAAAACPDTRAAPTIVIIGAGQAGGWAAQTLRAEGFTGRLVLLGDEPHPPHERPPLSKAVLCGTASPDSTRLMKPEAFEALALAWRPSTQALRIDRAARQVLLDDGEALTYDKLIICTGGGALHTTHHRGCAGACPCTHIGVQCGGDRRWLDRLGGGGLGTPTGR